jgi:cephalosporin hydroxylase
VPGVRALHRRLDHSLGEFTVDATSARAAVPNGELATLFFAHDGRGVHKWPHYFAAYERYLGPFRGTPVRMLELGVSYGGSLELWRRYLGEAATIIGVDDDPRCVDVGNVRIGSQADAGFLRGVVAEMGGVDIVIDDGSHRAAHQRASLGALWPLLSDGGVYVIEDVHTSYWWKFGGGYRRPGSAMEVAKSLADGMNAWYHRHHPRSSGVDAAHEVGSVAFYDGLIVIEKQVHDRPTVVKVGRPSF